MTLLKKFALWFLTGFIPVVIAACYGMPYDYRSARFVKPGRVLDIQSKAGIPGIQVLCTTPTGDIQSFAYSDEEGQFVLGYDRPCQTVLVEDIDGEENGGQYATAEVPFEPGDEDQVIELGLRPLQMRIDGDL
ncbi:MAG: hypothetical protein ABIJ09_08430 [Pseudomonadota bacterium]